MQKKEIDYTFPQDGERQPYSLPVRARAYMCILWFCALLLAVNAALANEGRDYSPVVQELHDMYTSDPQFAETLDKAVANVVPPGCSGDPKSPEGRFCWEGKTATDLFNFFEEWLTFVPNPSNGMYYYEIFYTFCLDNNYALMFVEAEPGLSWTQEFVKARGRYMDSPQSVTEDNMALWEAALGSAWNDYDIPPGGYKTFNQFFTRELKEPRPVVEGASFLAAPADCLVNMINYNLTLSNKIPTKYDEVLNIGELLSGSSWAEEFDGGTALSCILLPTVYHHFHAPIGGKVVESASNVGGVYFGMNGHFDFFANNGNVGGYKSRYGIFGVYHRAYFVIDAGDYGHVAMISVGLDDISSVNIAEKYRNVDRSRPVPIPKGERLGNFAYGGSMVILLFEKDVFSAVSVPQGAQLGPVNESTKEMRRLTLW